MPKLLTIYNAYFCDRFSSEQKHEREPLWRNLWCTLNNNVLRCYISRQMSQVNRWSLQLMPTLAMDPRIHDHILIRST